MSAEALRAMRPFLPLPSMRTSLRGISTLASRLLNPTVDLWKCLIERAESDWNERFQPYLAPHVMAGSHKVRL